MRSTYSFLSTVVVSLTLSACAGEDELETVQQAHSVEHGHDWDRRCGGDRCRPWTADCDHDRRNGCEAHLLSNPQHCGACGRACSFAHAAGACRWGDCKLGTCNPG